MKLYRGLPTDMRALFDCSVKMAPTLMPTAFGEHQPVIVIVGNCHLDCIAALRRATEWTIILWDRTI